MFQKLLVPLDGSRLAEACLPAAAFLAQRLQASVTLLHVIERDAPPEIHGQRHLVDPSEAGDYLDALVGKAFPPGVDVTRHVHGNEANDVARAIAAHAEEFASDLIVLCSHGSGGLRGLLFGRIAQRVIANGNTPVLVIDPAKGWKVPQAGCKCLLVPLDGKPDHEQGLPVAADLARVCEASLHLLRVVPTLKTLPAEHAVTGRLMPKSTAAMLDLAKEEALAYLQRKVDALQETGIKVTREVSRGEPARLIKKASKRAKVDLIVMGTHGKTGTDAFWSGSVTPKVCADCDVPLLLVPVCQPKAV